jgi:hypothetical protein
LSSLAVAGFLSTALLALPAGCEKNTDEVKYTRTVDGDRDVKVEKKVESDHNGYKSEKKIETDRGEYKTETKMKTDDDGSSKYEKKVETPNGDYKYQQKVDEHGNVKTDVHHDND